MFGDESFGQQKDVIHVIAPDLRGDGSHPADAQFDGLMGLGLTHHEAVDLAATQGIDHVPRRHGHDADTTGIHATILKQLVQQDMVLGEEVGHRDDVTALSQRLDGRHLR